MRYEKLMTAINESKIDKMKLRQAQMDAVMKQQLAEAQAELAQSKYADKEAERMQKVQEQMVKSGGQGFNPFSIPKGVPVYGDAAEHPFLDVSSNFQGGRNG